MKTVLTLMVLVQNSGTLKCRNSKQIHQTLFVHYMEYFIISNVICLINPQNGSWVLFTILRNSLYRGSLYRDLSVLGNFFLVHCFLIDE